MEDTAIAISQGAVGALCVLAGQWIKSKWGTKAKIEPDPLNVEKVKTYITAGECNRRMSEMKTDAEKSIVRIEARVDGLTSAIEDLDKKDETRICKLNERVDLLVAKISEVAGMMTIVKDSFMKATIGGRK